MISWLEKIWFALGLVAGLCCGFLVGKIWFALGLVAGLCCDFLVGKIWFALGLVAGLLQTQGKISLLRTEISQNHVLCKDKP